MVCCAPGEFADIARQINAGPSDQEIMSTSRALGDGTSQTELSVPAIHCGACIHRIEKSLAALAGVVNARVNLSARRVSLQWRKPETVREAIETLQSLGYQGHIFEPGATAEGEETRKLITAVAVSGFAAMNIMMLSVGVWSGADVSIRNLLHWGSAIIAVPALLYSGRIFYQSAWNALRHGRTNMDVPITIGVLLAVLLSLYDTAMGESHAYFDAAASLVFFLLIGRTLDHIMRERARAAVSGLAKLAARGAVVIADDGTRHYRGIHDIVPGMALQIAAGERVPVDGIVIEGQSDVDQSLVNGESSPVPARAASKLYAGTLNLTGPIVLRAAASAQDSFLAEITALMDVAETGKGKYRRIADRVSQFYAPVVHFMALLAFVLWMAIARDVHHSATIAISVLIITCPCALGLAVPIVHVVAARKLFEKGIMLKDGEALERLAQVDTVVFDKTGTLTLGQSRLANAAQIAREALRIAKAVAEHSRHPHALAIARERTECIDLEFDQVREFAGLGIEAQRGGHRYRLGRSAWALEDGSEADQATVLSEDGRLIAEFVFEDVDRPDLVAAVNAIKRQGYRTRMLSGDNGTIVEALAERTGISAAEGELLPGEKLSRIAALERGGHSVLMVGDGLNDGPALAAASVSMAPANAADVGRSVAGLVFLRDSLTAVPYALEVANRASQLVRENFAIAIAYNAIALPVALLGHVTPLIAALAMSASSVVVVGNAMRLLKVRVE